MHHLRRGRQRAHEVGDPVAQVDRELREVGPEDEAAGGRGQTKGRRNYRPQGKGKDNGFFIFLLRA